VLLELLLRGFFVGIYEIFDFTILVRESLESVSDRLLKVCLLVRFGLNVENKIVVSSIHLI